MSPISPELIVGLLVGGALLFAVLRKLFPKPQPKEKHFKCARCGSFSQHTERTIEAWRNNKTKFFCPGCHAKWLQSQPQTGRGQFSSQGAGGRSGCLGVVVLFAVLPVAAYFLVQSYV